MFSYAGKCEYTFSKFHQENVNKFELASLYLDGLYGMNKNRKKAFKLYREIQHYPPAQYALGQILLENQKVSKQRSGLQLIREAANENYLPAIVEMALSYITGIEDVVHPSREQTLLWLKKAVRQNYPPAQYLLATLYDGTKSAKAFSLMKKAAQQDFIPAQEALGFMYLEQHKGVRTHRWKEYGEYWLKKAEENSSQQQKE